MHHPDHGKGAGDSLRSRASHAAKKRYPAGKAFGRIAYFELQRGLKKTQHKRGAMVQGARARAHYKTALTRKRELTPAFAASAQLPVWQPLGPSSIPHGQTYGKGKGSKPAVSGRCASVIVDPGNPDRITLASAGGGLWGSIDQGATWRPLTDNQPTLSMGALAAAPNSPNIVYAGTGEGNNWSPMGMGLLRSADGGLTWQHVPSAVLVGRAIFDLAIDSSNTLHLLVATTTGLFESRDGGATCTLRISGACWDVSIHPLKSNQVLAATETGLQRSSDGGTTWHSVPLAGVNANTPTRARRLPCAVKTRCRSTSLPRIPTPSRTCGAGVPQSAFVAEAFPAAFADPNNLSQAWYDWCLGVAPDNSSILFWGAIDLYRGTRSASGKWQWLDISSRPTGSSIHPDQHHVAFDPSDPQVVYACCEGGLFRSPDLGDSWVSLNRGLAITEFEFLAQLEADPAWIIGGTQDNGTLGHAGLQVWNQIALGDGGACGTDESNGLCYHSYYGIGIERALVSDPTFAWKDVSPPAPDNYDALFYPPLAVDGARVARAGVTVFVSTDSGANWSQVSLPPRDDGKADQCSALVFATSKRLFAATVSGRMFRIERGNGDWGSAAVTALAAPSAGFISDIVLNGASLWVSVSSFGAGHVFRSNDMGANWSNRSGNLPDIPVNALVIDPQDAQRVFAATDHGVYQTANGGKSWDSFSNGLPNAVVGDLVMHESQRRCALARAAAGLGSRCVTEGAARNQVRCA
jgi:photosystem II stability/assembly factor-like uncharacterized protein